MVTKQKASKQKLLKLAAQEMGATVDELLEEATYDSVACGICTTCYCTDTVEPDQTAGWCSNCKTPTMKSVLVLAEIL